jgi:hypothetical protein
MDPQGDLIEFIIIIISKQEVGLISVTSAAQEASLARRFKKAANDRNKLIEKFSDPPNKLSQNDPNKLVSKSSPTRLEVPVACSFPSRRFGNRCLGNTGYLVLAGMLL